MVLLSNGRRRSRWGLALLAASVVLVAFPSPASAVAPPTLWLDAKMIDFGHVLVGTSSPVQIVTITNAGPGPASGLSAGATSSTQLVRSSTTCGSTLAPGASCTASYRYQPTVKQVAWTQATFTASGGTAVPVQLSGTPDAAAVGLRVTPTSHDFGPVAVGATSTSRSVAITNQSGAPVPMTLAGQAPSGPFQLAANTCPASPATLAAGASCTLDYRFAPTTAGPALGSAPLAVTQVGVGTVSFPVALRGHGGTVGAPILTISPLTFDFGRVAVGATAPTQTTTLTNTSGAPQTLTGLAGGGSTNFGGVNTCGGPLAAGASCTLSYAAQPPTVGLITDGTNGDMSIAGHGTQHFDIAFSAFGTGSAARPEHSPRSLDLGPSAIGTPTPSKVVTLRNNGTAALTGISITQVAPAVPQMAVSGTTCGASLAAGVSCTVTLRYTPTTTTPRFATLRIHTDAGDLDTYLRGGPIQTVHENFVVLAYEDFLDRDASQSEKSAASSALDSGTTTRRAFVTTLAKSDEWIQALVQDLYQDTLGRPGDSGGVAFWVGRIRSGRNTVAQVAAEFYASNEYYTHIGGGTDSTWVTDLYTKLLHRAPDPGGLSYWVGQTSSKGRASVAGRMFQSAESRRSRVTALYQKLLLRAPDAAGRDYWAGKIETKGDIVLAIELASSNEFLRLAQMDVG